MKITRDSDDNVMLNIPQGNHPPFPMMLGKFYAHYLTIRVGTESRKVYFTKEDILQLAELFNDKMGRDDRDSQ